MLAKDASGELVLLRPQAMRNAEQDYKQNRRTFPTDVDGIRITSDFCHRIQRYHEVCSGTKARDDDRSMFREARQLYRSTRKLGDCLVYIRTSVGSARSRIPAVTFPSHQRTDRLKASHHSKNVE